MRIGARLLGALGTLFLATQVALVARARFVESRDFCWAPHTSQVRYTIETVIDGRALTHDEISQRYRIPARGWDAHSYRNVIDLVAQYERTYGRNDRAQVALQYSVNGRETRIWRWQPR